MIFEPKEKLKSRDLKKLKTNLKNDEVWELNWLKLLTGYLDIKYKNKIIKQNNNYCVLGIKQNSVADNTLSALDAYIFSKESASYFLNNRKNNKLFMALYNELALFFIARYKKSHIEAFVHLYRIIEKMSIMFPLLYFKQSSDFKHVFNDVKSLIATDTHGLKFYKNFLKTIFGNSEDLDISTNFNFPTTTEHEYADLKNIFDNVISTVIQEATFIGNTITIPFRRIIDFAVTIRNRYFHLLIEHENDIEPLNLDMNDFFCYINNNVLNWIGVIYYRIFEIMLDK